MALKRKATFQPYDMDTALGTNNSGVLMFGYSLEDTDTVSSIISGGDDGGSDAPVFNAQDSVLWNNVRDAFRGEITQMYQQLRTSGAWSAQEIIRRAQEHQGQWCEAIYNEDQYYKHLIPLINPVTKDEHGNLIRTDRYLTMLQGSKEEQRKWWITNRYRYTDSKYVTGDAVNSVISMRLFNGGTLTLKAAIDLYLSVRFGGGSTPILQRKNAGESAEFTYTPGTGVTEMETWIYSADLITDVGDLSVFYGNEFDFSRATRLQRLKIGDGSANYSNTNLKTIDVRNSSLLEYIDVRNCPNLAITVNLEGSPILKEAYFDGTSITGCDLADGASIEKLHLPSTITTLTLVNLNKLTEFVCPDFSNVSRLMISNMDANVVNPLEILKDLPANAQVNIQGLNFEATGSAEIEQFLDLLDTMRGVSREKNSSGEWMYHDYDTAQVSGTIHTTSLTGAQIASYNQRYPYITVTADYVESTLTLMSYDNTTVLKTITCLNGTPQESIPSAPSKPDSADGHYSYTALGWSKTADAETADASATTDVIADRTVYPAYSKTVKTYTVTWLNNGTTIETDTGVAWGTLPHYDGSTPTYDGQTSTGWDRDLSEPITGNTTINATYKPQYTATFVRSSADGGGTLYSKKFTEGTTPVYGGATPTSTQGSAEDYPFEGWTPALAPIYANTTYTAKFGSPVEDAEITDSWDTIIASIDAGTYKTKYKIGNYKPLDLGTEGTVNMQIVAMDEDDLASGGKAPLTFIAKELLTTTHTMNSTNTTEGGYEASAMRTYLNGTILPLIPSNVAARLQSVNKIQSIYESGAIVANGQTTVEKLWIPSEYEINSASTVSESSGVDYSKIYKDRTSRIKNINGTATNWWLRSAPSPTYFKSVTYEGYTPYANPTENRGIALGFCLGLEPETITDSWSEIFAAEQDGTYSTKYSIGDTKMLDLGTEGQHLMEIVAFDEDDKADGSGKAKITWISKEQLNTTHAMSASKKTVDGETAYTAGGWEHSDMRTYLKDTVKPLIPETVRNAIVPVTKIQSTYTGGALVKNGQTTTDDVWIPSNHEVGFGTDYETTGAVYSGKFTNNASRIKKRMGSAKVWWLRSAYYTNYFRGVNGDGSSYYNLANNALGVALGFCT